MTKPKLIAYADCFSGISGDMLLGALLHAGLEEKALNAELAKLKLKDYSLSVETTSLQGISCRRVDINQTRHQELRTLKVIQQLLEQSELDQDVRSRSLTVFEKLAAAEAKVHGIDVEEVHFHEIGAIDTIIDIVGTIAGFAILGISHLAASPLPLGRGFVNCDHGRLPLPAPAVCELLRGVPSYGVDIEMELVTPTGAALIATLADEFGPIPPLAIEATGYGAGTHVFANEQPNMLRLIVGTPLAVEEAQSVTVIECHLDDYCPEGFPYLSELLLTSGALDLSLGPCQGKKGRPGYWLQVICNHSHSLLIQDILLSETTTIGLRYRQDQRRTLPREMVTIVTSYGEMLAKQVHTPQGIVIYPEFEECKRIASAQQLPLAEVYRAVYAHRNDS